MKAEVLESDFEEGIQRLARAEEKLNVCDKDFACLIFVIGGGTSRFLRAVEKQYPVTLLWVRSVLPKWLLPLRLVMASVAGLFVLRQPLELRRLVRELGTCGTVGILVVDRRSIQQIADLILASELARMLQDAARSDDVVAAIKMIFDAGPTDSIVIIKVKNGEWFLGT